MFSVGNWWRWQPFGCFQSETDSLRGIFPLVWNGRLDSQNEKAEKYRMAKFFKSVSRRTNYRAIQKNNIIFSFLIPPDHTIPTNTVGYKNIKKISIEHIKK